MDDYGSYVCVFWCITENFSSMPFISKISVPENIAIEVLIVCVQNRCEVLCIEVLKFSTQKDI